MICSRRDAETRRSSAPGRPFARQRTSRIETNVEPVLLPRGRRQKRNLSAPPRLRANKSLLPRTVPIQRARHRGTIPLAPTRAALSHCRTENGAPAPLDYAPAPGRGAGAKSPARHLLCWILPANISRANPLQKNRKAPSGGQHRQQRIFIDLQKQVEQVKQARAQTVGLIASPRLSATASATLIPSTAADRMPPA